MTALRASKKISIGRHMASILSSLRDLHEVYFNHFRVAKRLAISSYFQGSSPGVYARAFLKAVLEEQMDIFREVHGKGLSFYPSETVREFAVPMHSGSGNGAILSGHQLPEAFLEHRGLKDLVYLGRPAKDG